MAVRNVRAAGHALQRKRRGLTNRLRRQAAGLALQSLVMLLDADCAQLCMATEV